MQADPKKMKMRNADFMIIFLNMEILPANIDESLLRLNLNKVVGFLVGRKGVVIARLISANLIMKIRARFKH